MSRLSKRITALKELEGSIKKGDQKRQINILSYLQLLDYHIKLLEEVDALADSISTGDKEGLAAWMEKRVH